jgi:hypothetical protein
VAQKVSSLSKFALKGSATGLSYEKYRYIPKAKRNSHLFLDEKMVGSTIASLSILEQLWFVMRTGKYFLARFYCLGSSYRVVKYSPESKTGVPHPYTCVLAYSVRSTSVHEEEYIAFALSCTHFCIYLHISIEG